MPQQGGRILAQFNQYFQVSLTPTTDGTLAVSPASPIGNGFYLVGTSVTFTANPVAGFRFTGFTGNAFAGTTNPYTVKINKPITVGADFAPIN